MWTLSYRRSTEHPAALHFGIVTSFRCCYRNAVFGDLLKQDPQKSSGDDCHHLRSAGRVDGRVRILDSVQDGEQLQPGEILVTVSTNVGWTPIFPRAAGVITDVGAPLSHAAIVARELGIPAVVGCFNATTLLKTGDRVRVDGGQGSVEIIGRAT